jgi:vanillate O-demethylase ferredoxin subunit
MRSQRIWADARLAQASVIAEDVRLLTFDVDAAVPEFDPGSHINIAVDIGGRPAVRTYTAIPSARGAVAVAVKLHPQSRGGSRRMWAMEIGEKVRLTLPENRFELSWRAPHYLLLAGGIGITPIFGMARALAERGASMRLVYAARTRGLMAFADELTALLGDRLVLRDNSRGEHIDLGAEFGALPANAEVYLCGPIGMLEAAKSAWIDAGRPISRLRYEVFGDSGVFAESDFTVDVLNRNIRVPVRSDQTLLDALIEAGVDMIYDCQRGECGLCAVKVLEREGEIDHRDVFLSTDEKAESGRLCACVSRLTHGHAVIDIGYRAR